MALNFKQEYQDYKEKYLAPLANQQITKVSLELALFMIMIAVFALFALRPTIITIASLQQEIKLKTDVQQKLEKKVIALEQAQINLAKVQNSIIYLDRTLPEQADFNRFEREIEFLALKNNLILADAKFGEFDILGKSFTGKEDYIPLTFILTAAGNYNDLKKFLQSLENLDRLVIIDEIKFDKQTQVPGAQLQAKITGKTYYLPYSNQNKL